MVFSQTGLDEGRAGVQGVRTPAILIRVPFLKKYVKNIRGLIFSRSSLGMHKNSPFLYKKEGGGTDPIPLGAFGIRPPVPLSHGLDTCPCKILDPPPRKQWTVISYMAASG